MTEQKHDPVNHPKHYAALPAASVLAVENEIEAWKKAAALVRRVAGEVKP